MNNIDDFSINEIQRVYSCLLDNESKEIFKNRLLYSITDDYQYIVKLVNLDEIHKKLKKFEKAGKQLIIFGAGLNGKFILKYFSDIKWTCFVDNYLKVDNAFELKVINFEELKEKYFDSIIVISSNVANNQMYQQLIQNGFSKENIINLGEELSQMLSKQYFEFLPDANGNESFVDAGCFEGETSKAFVKWCNNKYDNIWAFEPDLECYKKCKENLDLVNCKIYNLGVYNENNTINFCSNTTYGSSKIDSEGLLKVKTVKIDDILKDEKITYIKMDVEGVELEALQGAENIIKTQKPRLAICVYHKKEDIITIPSLLLKYNPDYKFKLRHYTISNIETVLYAF